MHKLPPYHSLARDPRRKPARVKRGDADKRIERAYYRTCSGFEINVFDISKVYQAGRAALEAGADEAGLEKAIFDFVQTIKRN